MQKNSKLGYIAAKHNIDWAARLPVGSIYVVEPPEEGTDVKVDENYYMKRGTVVQIREHRGHVVRFELIEPLKEKMQTGTIYTLSTRSAAVCLVPMYLWYLEEPKRLKEYIKLLNTEIAAVNDQLALLGAEEDGLKEFIGPEDY